jgi:hypothetical protein
MEKTRPENIPGYEHPTSKQYSKSGKYKTFTEGQKPKKNEKFGSINTGDNYVSNKLLQENIIEDICPTCKEFAIYTCPCVYNDKKCPNNHIWYTNRNDGKHKLGNPHKN